MAGKVLNIKVRNPLKLRIGLTGKYHAICHYSYNLPLAKQLNTPKTTHPSTTLFISLTPRGVH